MAVKIPKDGSSAAKVAAVDPVLASLFKSSSGPVTAPIRSRSSLARTKEAKKEGLPNDSRADEEDEDKDEDSTSEAVKSNSDSEPEEEPRPRKRRRLSSEDDLEASYLNRLVREEEKENLQRQRGNSNGHIAADGVNRSGGDVDDDDTSSSASNDLADLSDLEPEDTVLQHESLTKPTVDQDKVRRTVFLGNVSTEAITSKSARKQLETHLKSVLDGTTETIESLRFRSIAVDVAAGPKKAAYAKKEIMDDTTRCTNAYVVLSTEVAARKISKKLNGSVVLDRHLHTDWLAHPTAIDHKRCVFVGNLNFVNVETNIDSNQDGEKAPRRAKAREPADAEEGLWRTFGKCGTIESVRVIRDKATRVGKGIAYVQFSDEVATEKALALDGKKFPPMLPRILRVSRAKRVLKKDLKRKRDDGQTSGRPGASGKFSKRGSAPGVQRKKKLDGVVFEGYRASADKGMKFKTKGKKKGGVKPTNRSSKRGAAFKAGGGKKNRDA